AGLGGLAAAGGGAALTRGGGPGGRGARSGGRRASHAGPERAFASAPRTPVVVAAVASARGRAPDAVGGPHFPGDQDLRRSPTDRGCFVPLRRGHLTARVHHLCHNGRARARVRGGGRRNQASPGPSLPLNGAPSSSAPLRPRE